MKAVISIAKRELTSYFVSPVAWIVAACFICMTGFLFVGNAMSQHISDMSGVFSNWSIFVFMMGPIITMKLLADEKRNGTLELLLTAPVRAIDIVLGKYLAALALYALILLVTLLFPIYLEIRSEIAWSSLFLQYFGVFLLGATILGIGLVASSLTNSTIIAAITGEAFALGLFMLSWLTNEASGIARTILEELTIISHYQSFMSGILDIKDVIYFFTFILFTIFVANKVVESSSWRS